MNEHLEFLLRDEWQKQLRTEVDYAKKHCDRIFEMDGDRFLLTIPTMKVAYSIAKAKEGKLFQPEKEEFWNDYLVSKITINMTCERGTGNEVGYVFRNRNSSWLRYFSNKRSHPIDPYKEEVGFLDTGDWAGVDGIFDGVRQPLRDEHPGESCLIRPMLIPLTKNGDWDRSLSRDIPDGELTLGGCLILNFEKPDGEKGEFMFGSKTSHYCGGLPKRIAPEGSQFLDLRLTNSFGESGPLHWRFYDNVLVCTRRFFGLPLTTLYNKGFLPIA